MGVHHRRASLGDALQEEGAVGVQGIRWRENFTVRAEELGSNRAPMLCRPQACERQTVSSDHPRQAACTSHPPRTWLGRPHNTSLGFMPSKLWAQVRVPTIPPPLIEQPRVPLREDPQIEVTGDP